MNIARGSRSIVRPEILTPYSPRILRDAVEFSLAALQRLTLLSDGSNVSAEDKDMQCITHTNSWIKAEADVFQNDGTVLPIAFRSADESIATVDAYGKVTYVKNGNVNIIGSYCGSQKGVSVDVAVYQQATPSTYLSYLTGSLGRHICDVFDTAIQSVTPENCNAGTKTGNLYTDFVAYDVAYSHRNPNFWLSDYDWSGTLLYITVPALNGVIGTTIHATLISPRHAISVRHSHPLVGQLVTYLDADGVLQTFTVVAESSAPMDSDGPIILKLDRDIPSSMCFYEVLPASSTLLHYLPNLANFALPLIQLARYRQTCFWGMRYLADVYPALFRQLLPTIGYFSIYQSNPVNGYPETLTYNTDYANLVASNGGGDSGSSMFLPINGKLVALPGYCGFFPYQEFYDWANNEMATLDGGSSYRLSYVDLSDFDYFE